MELDAKNEEDSAKTMTKEKEKKMEKNFNKSRKKKRFKGGKLNTINNDTELHARREQQ